MKCPHCLVSFHEKWTGDTIGITQETRATYRNCTCPACSKFIIQISIQPRQVSTETWQYAYPKAISRSPLPPELTDISLSSDYKEACLVLSDSAKASAALSRRCLQYTLREKGQVKPGTLNNEIEEIIGSGKLPADLTDHLHSVRVIGNFAAHAIKSENSGAIVEVEPGEAEWNLDVVEELIDYYYVRPARAQKRKDDLNAKLKAAGKPELQ